MQDWTYEVAEPEDLDKYLTLFNEARNNDDVRLVLADMIIQAFEELGTTLKTDARWTSWLNELSGNAALHGHLNDAWNVSSEMRCLSQSIQ